MYEVKVFGKMIEFTKNIKDAVAVYDSSNAKDKVLLQHLQTGKIALRHTAHFTV